MKKQTIIKALGYVACGTTGAAFGTAWGYLGFAFFGVPTIAIIAYLKSEAIDRADMIERMNGSAHGLR